MALHHAAIVVWHGRTLTARAFPTAEAARAFAGGVEYGAGIDPKGEILGLRVLLLDGRGSLAVTNGQLAAAREAGWEVAP